MRNRDGGTPPLFRPQTWSPPLAKIEIARAKLSSLRRPLISHSVWFHVTVPVTTRRERRQRLLCNAEETCLIVLFIVVMWRGCCCGGLLRHCKAGAAVVIVNDNCGVFAVVLQAHKALKRWAAGLLRLEGGCAVLGSIIHLAVVHFVLEQNTHWHQRQNGRGEEHSPLS